MKPTSGKKGKELKEKTHKLSHWKWALLVGLIGMLVYGNTLHHDYVLDDFSLIKENFITKKGTAGLKEIFATSYRSGYYLPDNDLYRPLSKAMFAIEWQLAPDKPMLSHGVNILLYGLTGYCLFYVLLLCFKDQLALCLLTSLLFITHPLHSEVVANIKSRDELIGFLFFLGMTWCALKYVSHPKPIYLLGVGISFFLSLLSKESGITFLVVTPLVIWFFTSTPLKTLGLLTGILALVAAVFLLIRFKVLGSGPSISPSIMDNLLMATPDKLLRTTTAIGILGYYLQLFVFPHPLVSDYSFNQIPLMGLTHFKFLLSFGLIVTAIGIALVQLKSKHLVSFALLYFFATFSLASNIFFIIGTSFGERLMYAPSLGLCLLTAYYLLKMFKLETLHHQIDLFALPKQQPVFVGIVFAILLLYAGKTYSRNWAWKDNYTLHSTDVKLSPNSARAHYYYGNIITQDEFLAKLNDPYVKKTTLDTGLIEMRRTLAIYPGFADALHKIGKIYLTLNQYDSAGFYYEKALKLNPGNSMYLNNYGNVLFHLGKLDEARKEFELSLQTNPNQTDACNNLASVYGTMGQYYASHNNKDEAIKHFNLALGWFKKSTEIDHQNAAAFYMLGITYRNLGDESNAAFYIGIAHKINPQYQ